MSDAPQIPSEDIINKSESQEITSENYAYEWAKDAIRSAFDIVE